MINFFRNIRQQLLKGNKFRKYTIYAFGEIVLVVIGILIALSINNWNEDRKERVLEKEVLSNLLISLSSDIEHQINFNIEQLEDNLQNINEIKKLLNEEIDYNDSMETKFRAMMTSKGFSPDLSAYKELENQGMHIIRNQELKKGLLKIYNNNYPEAQRRIENYQQNLIAFFRPVMYDNFAFNVNVNGTNIYTPINKEELIRNQLFKNTVYTAHLNFINNHKYFIRIQEEVTQIIEQIETELRS